MASDIRRGKWVRQFRTGQHWLVVGPEPELLLNLARHAPIRPRNNQRPGQAMAFNSGVVGSQRGRGVAVRLLSYLDHLSTRRSKAKALVRLCR